MNGLGLFKWTDGREYNGNYLKGKKHGKGVFKYQNGDSYNGDWVDSK
jgi:hypothetical protein